MNNIPFRSIILIIFTFMLFAACSNSAISMDSVKKEIERINNEADNIKTGVTNEGVSITEKLTHINDLDYDNLTIKKDLEDSKAIHKNIQEINTKYDYSSIIRSEQRAADNKTKYESLIPRVNDHINIESLLGPQENYKTIYTYKVIGTDENGKKIRVLQGSITYNDKGVQISSAEYNTIENCGLDNCTFKISESTYDSTGKNVEKLNTFKFEESTKKLHLDTSTTYNKNGQISSRVNFDENGIRKGVTEFKYFYDKSLTVLDCNLTNNTDLNNAEVVERIWMSSNGVCSKVFDGGLLPALVERDVPDEADIDNNNCKGVSEIITFVNTNIKTQFRTEFNDDCSFKCQTASQKDGTLAPIPTFGKLVFCENEYFPRNPNTIYYHDRK